MPIVRIARHAETTWNAIGRYQGRIDVPLSDLGRAQADALRDALQDAGIQRIISSPLSRCVETAAPLATAIGIQIHTDPLLTEIAHGQWEGRLRSEIAKSEPELYKRWREHPATVKFEDGESLSDVLVRWQRFVASFEVVSETLLMTHDVMVRIAVLERTGRPLDDLRRVRATNAGWALFDVRQGRWSLEAECVDSHLAGLKADPRRQAL